MYIKGQTIALILAAGVFILQPAASRAEGATPMLQGGVSMDSGTQAAIDAEEAEHDGNLSALDSVERGADSGHKKKIELIGQSGGDDKENLIADENQKYEDKKKDLARKRALEEKRHGERLAEIMEKAAEQPPAGGASEGRGAPSQGPVPSQPEPGGMGEAPAPGTGGPVAPEQPPLGADETAAPAQPASGGMEGAPSTGGGAQPAPLGSPTNPLKGSVSKSPAPPRPAPHGQQQARPAGTQGGGRRTAAQPSGTSSRAPHGTPSGTHTQGGKQPASPTRGTSSRPPRNLPAERPSGTRAGKEQAPRAPSHGTQPPDRRAGGQDTTRWSNDGPLPWSGKTIPERMMDLAREMDRVATEMQKHATEASNEFFGGMADSIKRSAEFLAQKPGSCVPQMAKNISDYLTNDYKENNQKLYDEAVKAVDEIQKNPARFFGEHAGDIALAAGGAMGEMGAIPRAAEAAGEAGAAGKMGQIAKGMEKAGGKAAGEGAQAAGGVAREGKAAEKMAAQQQKQAERVRQAKEQLRRERSGGSGPQQQPPPQRAGKQSPQGNVSKEQQADRMRRAEERARAEKQRMQEEQARRSPPMQKKQPEEDLGETKKITGEDAKPGAADEAMTAAEKQAERIRQNKEQLRKSRSSGGPQQQQPSKQPEDGTLEVPAEIEGAEGWPKSGGAGSAGEKGGPPAGKPQQGGVSQEQPLDQTRPMQQPAEDLKSTKKITGEDAKPGSADEGMTAAEKQAERIRENKERLREERSSKGPQRQQPPGQPQPQGSPDVLEIPAEIEGVEGWPKPGGRAAVSGLEEQGRAQLRDARDLEKAGRTLKGMVDDSREFSGYGAAGVAGPDFPKIFPPSAEAKGPVNIAKAIDKNAGNQNCFPVALAAAKRWKTGRPYVAPDHNPHVPLYDPSINKFVYDDVPTPGYAVMRALKKEFGSGKAKNPFHGGARGYAGHQEGIPVTSSQTKIERALKRAGDRSQGLVFVDGGPDTPYHVFNVRNSGGKVEFWDFQADPPVQYLRFGKGNVTMRANGVTASAPLGWKRIYFYRLD
ncbi:MAG TPA: hypothetical protein P5287_00450 [bacterium]|nr:hypothetical protein [bacterium]